MSASDFTLPDGEWLPAEVLALDPADDGDAAALDAMFTSWARLQGVSER